MNDQGVLEDCWSMIEKTKGVKSREMVVFAAGNNTGRTMFTAVGALQVATEMNFPIAYYDAEAHLEPSDTCIFCDHERRASK